MGQSQESSATAVTESRTELKKKLRSSMLKQRDALRPSEVQEKSAIILERLEAEKSVEEAQCIMAFVSLGNEFQTRQLLESTLRNKRLFLPRIEGGRLICCEVKSLDSLIKSKFGILEPPAEHVTEADKMDVIIVPGLAFDKRCYRVGFGAGHYDRFLAGYKGTTIGVGYDFQLVEEVPEEDWDIPLSAVLSEKRIFTCGSCN